jgi:4-hydroxy-2-oxoheptanedioate aldolase
MRTNMFKKHLADGKLGCNGWVAIPNAYSTEVYAAAGWDAVTLDMQHGAVTIGDVLPLLQAVCQSNATPAPTPMVRVPWNEPGVIQHVLDAGAYGVICPMINTRAEAEAFVNCARYAPLGSRSFGPFRASVYGGADYWQHANAEVLLLAMIETRTAIKNLDEILSVKGLDGIYLGPSDLSLSMGKTPTLDPVDPEVLAAIKDIVNRTRAKGMIAGAHTDSAATAAKRYADGYQFCTLFNDVRVMANAASAMIKEARGLKPVEASKSY